MVRNRRGGINGTDETSMTEEGTEKEMTRNDVKEPSTT